MLHTQGVTGSIPVPPTILHMQGFGAIAQLGERLNGIQEVSGSIPLSSTKFPEAWCSGLTCGPVTAETAGSNPVASATGPFCSPIVTSEWRNWQTRTFEGRVGNRTGSSPVSDTMKKTPEHLRAPVSFYFGLCNSSLTILRY